MSFEPNQLLNLSIDWNTKGIPYKAEEHPHGSRNHGYSPLKGRLEECTRIPEAQDEPSIVAALQRLNAWPTAFFTSGCETCYNARDGQARPIGYVEFSFNSIEKAKSVTSYFELYCGLYEKMRADRYENTVGFLWNLSPTRFDDHGERGYSAAVFLQSFGYMPTSIALGDWHRSLEYLVAYLCAWPDPGPPYFYAPVNSGDAREITQGT